MPKRTDLFADLCGSLGELAPPAPVGVSISLRAGLEAAAQKPRLVLWFGIHGADLYHTIWFHETDLSRPVNARPARVARRAGLEGQASSGVSPRCLLPTAI